MRRLLCFLWLVQAYAATVHHPDIRAILTSPRNEWSPGTIISFPNSEAFENATSRWTTTGAPSFSAAISPINEADVASAVKLATKHNIPLLATSKRHGFTTTLGNLKAGLEIDLTQLNSYTIDSKAGTVTIGAGVGYDDFQDDLDAAGYMIQGGTCACPSYVGLTVGAGIGRFIGYFGFVTDALISARVVTASGSILEVSETQNSDLFWGLRGAGANLGIITSATYQAHNKSQHNDGYVLTLDIYFSENETTAYFQYLDSINGNLPGNVASSNIWQWNQTTGQPQLLSNWVWIGSEKAGREWLAPLLSLSHSMMDNFVYIPWNKLLETAIAGFGTALCDEDRYRDFYSVNVRNLSGSTYQTSVEKLSTFYRHHPDALGSFINFEIFPSQAAQELDSNSTAYPWRDTIGYMQIGIYVTDPTNQTTVTNGANLGSEIREDWIKTSGYSEFAIYVNYAHGDETVEQKYSRDRLPHLAALKKEWDPTNVFRFNNELPSEYP